MPDRAYLSWPFFEESHRRLALEVETWAKEHVERYDGDGGVDAECREIVGLLGRDGYLRHAVPAPYGGSGQRLDVRSLCLVRETLARYSGLADFAFAMQGLGSGPISLFGSEELRRKYLPAVSEGRAVAALALTEARSGSDVGSLETTARRDGSRYVLNGTKTLISNAGVADFYVVFARTSEGPGAKGLGAFVVDSSAGGLEVTARLQVIAPHPLGELAFRDCAVPASGMVGEPGDGFKIAMRTLDLFRPTVGAAALGFARRAFDEALDRAGGRKVFGRPLSEHQMTQHKIADMATEIDASALLVYRAAHLADTGGGRVRREASMAKLFATEAAQRVIDAAVQLFGGLGVVKGARVERLYREIRPLRLYEGTSEIQRLVIARETSREREETEGSR